MLASIGKVAMQVTKLVLGLGPAFAAQRVAEGKGPGIFDKFDEIANLIIQAEIFGQALGLPGAQKLKGVTPAVIQIILNSSIVAGKKINDEGLFQRGATKMADGMADVLNSLKGKVETEDFGD